MVKFIECIDIFPLEQKWCKKKESYECKDKLFMLDIDSKVLLKCSANYAGGIQVNKTQVVL